MHNPTTASDAIALLSRSQLPTVLTEGREDYRVLRRIEERLADIGVNFLPLSGRDTVLQVWQALPESRKHNTLALVDLDKWIYVGIPDEFIGDNLMYTIGYSIENDLILDGTPERLLYPDEKEQFEAEVELIAAEHARQVEACKNGQPFTLAKHPNEILNAGDMTPTLGDAERSMKSCLNSHFRQFMRGKTVFELLARQLNRPQRPAKIGYRQIYEFASANTGPIFANLEDRIRLTFGRI